MNWSLQVVEVPITVTLDAYIIGDVVGGLLSCAVPQINGGGYISWVRVVDDADQAEPFKLHCFYSLPSTIANDAAYAPTEADRTLQFTTIDIPAASYGREGADAGALVVGKDKLALDYILFPNLPNGMMYFYLEAVDTPDYADENDLTLHIGFMVM